MLVQRKLCETCIYKPNSPLSIKALEAEVADPHMEGFFTGYRICHHTHARRGVCCAGFWRRHKDKFMAGQIAQRLHLVQFVDCDEMSTSTNAPCGVQGAPSNALHGLSQHVKGEG